MFKNFLFTIDASYQNKLAIEQNLIRMIKLKFSNKSPRKPPQIIVLGPPGSGRSTQASLLAQQFGLVKISVFDLLKNQKKVCPELGKDIQKYIDAGVLVPDSIINNIVEERLNKSDCRVNGWVLEGYPHTELQVKLLQSLKIKPTAIFMFNQTEKQTLQKLSHRRVDPFTGKFYNMKLIKLADRGLTKCLVEAIGKDEELKKLGFGKVDRKVQKILIEDNPDASPLDLAILNRLTPSSEDNPATVK